MKRRILAALLAAMLLLGGCGGKQNDAPARKADSDMIIITENYAEDGHYTDSLDNSWTYSYHVPQLTADTAGARAINAAIDEKFGDPVRGALKDMQQALSLGCVSVSWKSYRYEDVLSLVVKAEADWEFTDYAVYLYDAGRGVQLTTAELLEKLGKGVGIMTHCNAGTLATAKYGTALAPMYIALEHGWDGKKDLHVYCDETRPLLQGARLSAYEMQAAGIDTYVQCDNMASYTMKSGKIGIIFVGCDRVAANGDFANKIGTSGVAILARHYGIPVYTLGPTSTIDMNCPDGGHIPIELRDGDEIKNLWYEKPMALPEVKCFNPSFDVTDHELLTGIVTEKGICYPPFTESLAALFDDKK